MKRNHPSYLTAHTNPWQKSSSNARQGFVFHNKIGTLSSQKRGKLHGKPKASAHGASKASFKRKLCLLQNLCRHLPEEMRSIRRQVPVPGGWVGLWHCSSWSVPRLHWRLLGCRSVSLCSSQTHQSAAATQFKHFYTAHTNVHSVTSGQRAVTVQKHLWFTTCAFVSPIFFMDSITDISLPFQTVTCLHGLAKQSQKFCRFNKIADNVSWASVTLGIRCTKKCYVIFNLLQVTMAWDSNI